MTRLQMLAVWLRRIAYCRGFGVQSPSAYSFIRYVVNEHYPYYAYTDLQQRWEGIRNERLKMCRLLFRLANYAQARQWAWCGTANGAEREYIQSGCRHTTVCDITYTDHSSATVGYVPATEPIEYRRDFVQRFVALHSGTHTNDKTMLVIGNIGQDAAAKTLWKELLADRRTGISFDLYYCGIVFFDKRFKQNYTVNF